MATSRQTVTTSGLHKGPLSYTSAMVYKCDNELNSLANISLDRFANGRIKKAKMATGAFKYTFPFYNYRDFKRPFIKLWNLLVKDIHKKIPYISSYAIPLIKEHGIASNAILGIDLALPYHNFHAGLDREVKQRFWNTLNAYIAKVNRHAIAAKLPVTLVAREETREYPASDPSRVGLVDYYRVAVVQIRLHPIVKSGHSGYYFLMYLDQIEKFIFTLHRLGVSTIEKTTRYSS